MENNWLLLLCCCLGFYVTPLYHAPGRTGNPLCCYVEWKTCCSVKALQPPLGGKSSSSGPSNGAAARQHDFWGILNGNQGVHGNHSTDFLVGRHWLTSSTAGDWRVLLALPLWESEWEHSGMCWLFLQAVVAPGDHLHTSTFRLFVCTYWAIVSTTISSVEKRGNYKYNRMKWFDTLIPTASELRALGQPEHLDMCLHETKYWLVLLVNKNITAIRRNWVFAFYLLNRPDPHESWY